MKFLNGKAVDLAKLRIMLKNDDVSLEDVLEETGMSSIDELDTALRSLPNYTEYKGPLKRIKKRGEKNSMRVEDFEAENQVIPTEEEKLEHQRTAKLIEVDRIVALITSLRESEKEKLDRIESYGKRLSLLLEEIDKIRYDTSCTQDEIDSIKSRIEKAEEEKTCLETEISAIEQHLSTLQIINISYVDGEIKTSRELPDDFSIPEEAFNAKYLYISNEELCEDFTAKVLKTIARMLAMVDALKAREINAEIDAESSDELVSDLLAVLK